MIWSQENSCCLPLKRLVKYSQAARISMLQPFSKVLGVAIKDLEDTIDAALGNKKPDLLIENAKIINTYSAEIEEGSIAVFKGRIAEVGDYTEAKEVFDAQGLYASPSFIDAHTHIESTHLTSGEYAKAVVPKGTGAVIADPHELANVCGLAGLKYLIESSKNLPLDIYFMAPSCVPASPFETSGATLGLREIKQALKYERVLGLAEMMNYPGLLSKDKEVLEKIAIASDYLIDGHVPSLSGKELNAYIAAGISTDHESTELEIAREKLRRGLKIMIREGTSEKNLKELLPLVNERNSRRFFFATDDRSPYDLIELGHINYILKQAVAQGLDPITAIQIATINPAEHYGLVYLGAIAPGKFCNLVLLENLKDFEPKFVFYQGQIVAKDGKPRFAAKKTEGKKVSKKVRNTVHLGKISLQDLIIPESFKDGPLIEVIPGQVITKKSKLKPKSVGGELVSDTKRDILKLFVFERHRATGRIGKGFVQGFGLKKGALASSIAHDAHNIIAVGVNDEEIYLAVKEIERSQGGLVAISKGMILAKLPLPMGGLLSDESVFKVKEKMAELMAAAKELGSKLADPFAVLSFLALSVIPEIRLTDRGLVDVEKFRLIE